jgi:hypothetical protein
VPDVAKPELPLARPTAGSDLIMLPSLQVGKLQFSLSRLEMATKFK